MKKKFVFGLLLLVACLLVVGCGDKDSSSSSNDSKDSKKNVVLKCTNTSKENQSFYSEVVLRKGSYHIESGKIEFTLKYENNSENVLNTIYTSLKENYCGTDTREAAFPHKSCDVKLDGSTITGEVELDPDKLAQKSSGKNADEFNESDMKNLERTIKTYVGGGATCETSKR